MRSLLLNPTTTLEEDLNSKFLIYSQKTSILLLYGRNNMEVFLLYSNYRLYANKFFINYQKKI